MSKEMKIIVVMGDDVQEFDLREMSALHLAFDINEDPPTVHINGIKNVAMSISSQEKLMLPEKPTDVEEVDLSDKTITRASHTKVAHFKSRNAGKMSYAQFKQLYTEYIEAKNNYTFGSISKLCDLWGTALDIKPKTLTVWLSQAKIYIDTGDKAYTKSLNSMVTEYANQYVKEVKTEEEKE